MTQQFGLIIIGDEILSGKRADKHLSKVIEILGARGLPLAYAEYVGMTQTASRALQRAFASGDVVFSTGVSVPRPMITHANVRPAPWVWGWNCTPGRVADP